MVHRNSSRMGDVIIFVGNDDQMKNIIAATLFFAMTPMLAQQALEFDETDYDFGQVEEAGGPVDHTFEFVNNSLDSLRIVGVKASCGCTTPNWSKETVPPGGKGFITARYNPMNRPGAFRKSLRVTTTQPSVNSTLYIKGTVNPKPRTIEDDLPTKLGVIRMKYRSFNFGKITTKEPVTKRFDVYNEGDNPVSFLPDQTEAPEYIKVVFEPERLEGKSMGKIAVTYDPNATGQLGFQNTKIAIQTSEVNFTRKDLNVIATIEEYFAPLTPEEMAEAPKLSISQKSHDFGKIGKDAVVETSFVLTNDGKSPLNIRQAVSNCGCTTTDLETKDLEPGASTTMKVKFDSKGRRGRQYKTVTLFSNDPVNPTQVLSVRAEVPREN